VAHPKALVKGFHHCHDPENHGGTGMAEGCSLARSGAGSTGGGEGKLGSDLLLPSMPLQ
jgi:hypothetical protein